MRRRDFLQTAGLLGLGATMGLAGCSNPWLDLDIDSNFTGKVIIIGAGASGLAAAHALDQYGIDFQVLEASNRYLGRITEGVGPGFFWNGGAEWVLGKPEILTKMVASVSEKATYELIHYSPADTALWDGTAIKSSSGFSSLYGKYKIRNFGWNGFFGEHFIGDLTTRVTQIAPVVKVDYSSDRILVETDQGVVYTGDRVICTAPINVYKDEDIEFIPGWPSEKQNALNQVDMPDGIKVLFECTEKFYPDVLAFNSGLDQRSGEAFYYDPLYGYDFDFHYLAFSAVGDVATPYTELEREDSEAYLKEEISRIFGSSAREKVKFCSEYKNWSKDPFIKGSYSHYKDYSAMDILAEPLDGRVYFAGEALSKQASATVHGAFQTGLDAVERLLTEA
ncbi:MAG: NAD(P)/FAD-dependent oxidoreductase [Bacteroidota bacterium]